MNIRTLLVTADGQLARRVADVVGSVAGCEMEVISDYDQADAYVAMPDLGLILIHQSDLNRLQDGLRLVRRVSQRRRPVPVIVIGNDYDPAKALDFFHAGAADCLFRPLDMRRLALMVEVLTAHSRRAGPYREATSKKSQVQSIGTGQPLLYNSTVMTDMIEQVRLLAPLSTTILLNGETGTGKTQLARLIHELSSRCKEPFLVADCGALSESLAESELFGHVKGAFTGAERDHIGKFAAVGGGTLMIDEIDALPLATQGKLLRAVDERVFEPVGSNRTEALRARIVVATNNCLEEEVKAGRFRADLFYRVNVVAFRLPPLRERRSLVCALAEKWLAEYAAEASRPQPLLSEKALAALEAYDWPGNIRELRNVIERAVALCRTRYIELKDLPEMVRGETADVHPRPSSGTRVREWLEAKGAAERHELVAALDNNRNNRSRAARELGISRVTLYKRLHKYGLT